MSQMACSNDITLGLRGRGGRAILLKHSWEHTAYQKLICSESAEHN